MKRKLFVFLFTILTCHCSIGQPSSRLRLDLAGNWQFAIDSNDHGITKNWFIRQLSDSITLPGTMDIRHKGPRNKEIATGYLNRVFTYEGPAWYRRDIVIPATWKDKYIELVMERTKPSKVWIDDRFIGGSTLLGSPQMYNLSQYLTPGKHTITICVNNHRKITPYGNVHIYSDDTQTNWNGIIGDFYMEASDKDHITGLQVCPDIDNKKIKVFLATGNACSLDSLQVELQVTKELNGRTKNLRSVTCTVKYDTLVQLEYVLGKDMDLWDEYHQPVYRLNAVISNKGRYLDNMAVPFGMRKFATHGTNFSINDRITFLRGKHDACVFPLTGFPPMDIEGWRRVFKIARSYGINHYRFHSWCPPDAAFTAADQAGIYLQPELPFWGGLTSDTVAQNLKAEGLALLKAYANHPSFVMMGGGNELWSGYDKMKEILTALKKANSSVLYSMGSNNSIGYVGPMEPEDYHVAARVPYAHDTILTHTRLTHAFADSRDGGILNTRTPSATVNFEYAVQQTHLPLISHEVGQYQVFPDYAEIKKYTGILKATNLEIFRSRLEKAGMLDQNKAFTKASGALSALCYRAEIEAALATRGLGGFQLLDLQDYPGQGTALVGILDAFMDSKNVITNNEWRHFCNDVVPLLVFEKYCWTAKETFLASVQVANYSNKKINKQVVWQAADRHGHVIKKGVFNKVEIQQGGLSLIGQLAITLAGITTPEKLTITVSIEGAGYQNSYSIWVYPQPVQLQPDRSISIATSVNGDMIDQLKNGGKVLLFPDAAAVKKNSLPGLFPPDFWNYGMFKSISEGAKKPVSPGTLGILTNPAHPLFTLFPTEYYTNWQWWSIIKNSNALILNATPAGYRPIVQVIDNIERNNKLGLIFEFRVGAGKLFVCMSRLLQMQDKPEANQLYKAILAYMQSDQFTPDSVIDENKLYELFQ